jgi:hypothetical protein
LQLKVDREINNATLIQFKTYHSGESDFLKFWDHCRKDPVRFIRRMEEVQPSWFKNEQTEDFSSVVDRLIESGECV